MNGDQRNAQRLGLAMCVLGVGVAVVAQELSWRTFLLWLLALALIAGGAAVWAQNRTPAARDIGRRRSPTRAEGDYGTSARLTVVPNLPIAEMLCQELRSNGIEAFYKAALPSGLGGVASVNPASPAEIWVSEADLDQARQFLPRV